jgi:hypothetical protein
MMRKEHLDDIELTRYSFLNCNTVGAHASWKSDSFHADIVCLFHVTDCLIVCIEHRALGLEP